METLYHEVDAYLNQLQFVLGKYEKANRESDAQFEEDIRNRIQNVQQKCDQLDIKLMKEPPALRQTAKMRVDQLKYDCRHYETAFNNMQHRKMQRAREENQREELLRRSFTKNQNDTNVNIDADFKFGSQLHRVNRSLDDILASGTESFESIQHHRSIIETLSEKAEGIANTLGVSNTLMRMIERRGSQDKLLAVGGIIFVSSMVLFVFFFL